MEYVVEISNMQGDGVAEREYSVIESSNPLPVPNVGDSIYVRSGGGSDYKQAQMLKVMHRRFTYMPEMGSAGPTAHVQLYCQATSEDIL